MNVRVNVSAIVALAICAFASGCHSLPSQRSGLCDACPPTCGCDYDGGALCDDANACDGCDSCACDSCGHPQIVRGRPNRILDGTGSFLGFANKLALWDRRADSHRISQGTETQIVRYLRRNRLDGVLVRVNQYDPVDEWRRIVGNDRVAAPWKYTFGTYNWLSYTLFPGRLLGGDWYNPYSDSLHLYSDIPAIGLAKAAYAKDVNRRTLPGTYAAFQGVPVIGLWKETLANREVMRYLRSDGTRADQAEAKRILYPDYGGAVGSQVLGFLPYGSVYGRAAGALAGHAARVTSRPDQGADLSSIR